MKKRILSVLLCLVMVLGMMPTMAFAGSGTTTKAIQLGTDGLKDPTPTTGNDGTYYAPNSYIYFGVNSSAPIKWRVLDADADNNGTTNRMFLMSEYTLNSSVRFTMNTGKNKSNVYQGSYAQYWVKNFASSSENFSTAEQDVMVGVTKTEKGAAVFGTAYAYPTDTSKSSELTVEDKMFLMSVFELRDYVGNYHGAAGLAGKDADDEEHPWYLRSAEYADGNAGGVAKAGRVTALGLASGAAMRPAFNLDSSKILFVSAAEGGKSADGISSGLTAVTDYDGNEWKLTLLDSNRKFDVTETNVSGVAGGTVSLAYTGGEFADNEWVSALLVNGSDEVLYYGRIAKSAPENTVSMTIPSDLAAGEYTLKVFSEQCNGDKKTDYASEFDTVTLTVTAPEAKIGTTYYATLGNALEAASSNDAADTIEITSLEVTAVTGATLKAGDSIETYAQMGTGNKITATTDATLSVGKDGTIVFTGGKVNIVNGGTYIGGGVIATGAAVVEITETSEDGGMIWVSSDAGSDYVYALNVGVSVKIDNTEYKVCKLDSSGYMIIEVVTDGNKLISGAVEVDANETIYVGNANTKVTNNGGESQTIIVSANTPSGSSTVTVPADGRVTIGTTEYGVGTDGATFVIDANDHVTLTSGSATLDPGAGVTVGSVSVTNPAGSGEDIVVSAEEKTVTVPKGGQANIGEDKITDVGQNMTFTIGKNGKAEFVLGENDTVTINGVKYTGLKTTDDKTVTAEEKTTASIPENASISQKDKETIGNITDKTQVQGVTEAVKNSMDALITKSEINTGAEGVVKIDVDVDVKVELTAAELSSEEKQIMTYTATPVATVTTKNSAGSEIDKKENVAVPNSLLSGEMTVRLPLPEGFEPEQIKHSSSDGSVEYFLKTSARGAKTFTIEDGCAVFTITKFSTFELSSTKTYVEPSNGNRTGTVAKPSVNDAAEDAAADGSGWPFTDVPADSWYYSSVEYVHENGLMTGTSRTTFSPNADTTRGMIVTILARLEGESTSGTPWYAAGQNWAMANGVSDGTGMERCITREQLAAMLYRYAKLCGYDVTADVASIQTFADYDTASAYAREAMAWCVENGLIQGSNGRLAPQESASRAQVATILTRFAQKIVK